MMDHKTTVVNNRMAAIAVCLSAICAPAWSQTAPVPSQNEVDQVFRDVIANPASVDLRTKYASLLVRSGNYEGGIAALEGLLLAPDAPANIRLELAVLYYRLGSYAMAETYLRDALADPRLDAKQKDEAQSLLRDVAQRNKQSRLSGMVMLGLRTQTNPTGATDNGTVLSQGLAVPRGPDFAPKSDTDMQVWALLDHVYDLEQQNEAAIATTLVGYANHYSSVTSYAYQVGVSKPFDLTVVAGSTGLRFKPMPDSNRGLTLRPHLVFGGATANGKSYFSTGGWGIDGDYRLKESVTYGGTYENTRLTYPIRDDIANAPSMGGSRQVVRLNASMETGANRFLLTEFGYVDHDGNVPYTAFRGPELRVSYVFSYASPVSTNALPWASTITVNAARREHRAADPAVSLLITRQDTEWRLGLINVAPVSRDVAVQLQLEYSNTNSNIPNYSITNTSGSLGVIWKY
jgi:hypothetical protein